MMKSKKYFIYLYELNVLLYFSNCNETINVLCDKVITIIQLIKLFE